MSTSSWRTGTSSVDLRRRWPVALGRPTGARPAVAGDGDLEVAAAGQLVEVVAGHVGVQVEALGDLGGGDAVVGCSWAKR